MAFSISSIFGGNPAPVANAAPQPQPPGSIPPNSGVTDPANTTVPPGGANTTVEPAAPLADFAKLWERSTETPQQPVIGAIDPQKLMAAAQKQDFAKAIPKEVMAKIQAGGQEGQEAFAAAMNAVTQTVYANSAAATAKIVEQALAKQQENFEAKLPQILKQHTLSDTLRSENPIFSNPAVAPLIKAMEFQLASKHPNASAAELSALAKQYVGELGAVFSPKAEPTQAEKSNAARDVDWSAVFGV